MKPLDGATRVGYRDASREKVLRVTDTNDNTSKRTDIMSKKVPVKLSKVVETHLPVQTSSSRSIQRVAALYIGHTEDKIERAALHEVCSTLQLFDFEGGGKKGRNNFGANFTMNMKKDAAYFSGDHQKGWKLTPAGKEEAVRIFDRGEAPTRRRAGKSGRTKAATTKAKPKPKKASGKKVSSKKKATTAKPKTKTTTKTTDSVKRKAAARRKKRDLSKTTT